LCYLALQGTNHFDAHQHIKYQCLMALQQLAREINLDLVPFVRETWIMQPHAPAWALYVTSVPSILKVLELAQKTALQLGIVPSAFETIEPGELSPYWAINIRNQWGSEPLRDAVDPDKLMIDIARAVASSMFSMHQQTLRYRNFLQFGPPPGVQQFPKYSASERTRTMAVDWGLITNAAQRGRSTQYASCTASQPRRAQSLRSQQCTPNDVLYPALFV